MSSLFHDPRIRVHDGGLPTGDPHGRQETPPGTLLGPREPHGGVGDSGNGTARNDALTFWFVETIATR